MRKGFTLIELLVVIAIIAILAAILFPVFSRARSSAKKATCQSNLKQMMLAVNMYATDQDDMMPCRTRLPAGHPLGSFAYPTMQLDAYLSDEWYDLANGEYGAMLRCPVARTESSTWRKRRPFYVPWYNTWGAGYEASLGECVNPSGTVFLNESYCSVYARHTFVLHPFVRDNCNVWITPDSTPHNAGSNFGFADGHVKWLSNGKFADRDTWRDMQRWDQ
jgi:prepilin-type N-terminal cleavage/methylation domain-containing protein/prepilin-type processing-associated H-X9-DG protein